MNEQSSYHFILGIFILLLAFNHFYPDAHITHVVTWAVAILAFCYIIKGIFVSILGGEYVTFWTGCSIALILIIFFNGLPILLHIANYIIALAKAIY